MRAMIVTSAMAMIVVMAMALPSSAQQGGQQVTVVTKFCVLPYKAAGVPNAGIDPNIPAADFADGTINCTNSRAGQEVSLACSTIIPNYPGSTFQGTAPCDIDQCGVEITRTTGTLKISRSGNVNWDCKIGKNK